MELQKRYRIDFHTHILPGMDDGAETLTESLAMLSSLAVQSVGRVYVTPHFILHRESLSSFLKRRKASEEILAEAIRTSGKAASFPEVRLGAEVRLESELLELSEIKTLCYAGTNALLLEFPFAAMERRYFETLENLVYKYNIVPVIAHLDRYTELFDKREIHRILTLKNVIIQLNTSVFRSFSGRRFALSLLRNGTRVILGSDAHNMGDRPPALSAAYRVLERKLSGADERLFLKTEQSFF